MQTIHQPVDASAIDRFMDWLKEMSRKYYEQHYPNLDIPAFRADWGKRNIRIVHLNREGEKYGSVYCFVEIETGKIMKAGSYKAPEPKRYERGNVNNPETWEDNCHVHGVRYLN